MWVVTGLGGVVFGWLVLPAAWAGGWGWGVGAALLLAAAPDSVSLAYSQRVGRFAIRCEKLGSTQTFQCTSRNPLGDIVS